VNPRYGVVPLSSPTVDKSASMFVGRHRQAEVHRLADMYDRVRLTAEPHLVVYSAPPGWGKTRIVQEFYRLLAARQPEPAYWPPTLVPSLGPAMSGFLALANERKTVRHREITVPTGASMPWLWLAPASGRLGDGSPAPVLDNLTNQISRHLPHLIARLERRRLLTRATYRTIVSTVPLLEIVELAESAAEVGDALMQAYTQWRRERQHDRSERRIDYVDDADRGAGVYQMLETLVEADTSKDRLPIVLILDDAHNLDGAALSFLQNAITGQLPLLAIATAWPEKLHTGSGPFGEYVTDAVTSDRVTTVELEPLTTDDLVEYVIAQLPQTDPRVVGRLAERAGGNPYALRLLLDVPRVRAATTEGRMELSVDEIDEIDGGLSNLLGQHWAELSHGVRQILVAAAMLGESFLDEVLVAGLGRIQLSEGLDAAIASAWIRVVAGAPGTLAFVERLRFEIARDQIPDVLSPTDRAQILSGALGAVRAQLPEEHSPRVRRMLLALHVMLATAVIETDLAGAAASAHELGDWARREHRRAEAIGYLQQAVHWHRLADGTGNAHELILCLIDLSSVLRAEHGSKAEGEPAALEALELADRDLPEDDELRIRVRCALVRSRRRREDAETYQSSLELIAEAEQMLAKLAEASPDLLRDVMSAKAGTLASNGDYQQAMAIARTLVAHCENNFGRLHRLTLDALEDFGFNARRAGLVQDAIGARRQVLARRTELISELGYLQTAAARDNLAFTLIAAGDDRLLDEAEQLVNDAYQAWSRAFGSDGIRPQRATLVRSKLWQRRGLAAERRGDQAAAEDLFGRASEAAARVVRLRRSRGVSSLAIALQRYGTALACQRLPAAIPQLEEALDIRGRMLRQDRTFWEVQDCARDLRWAHRRLGREAEANAVTRLYKLADDDR
jgi:AAA ATPase-like protein